jgi:hypothetical protein
MSRRTPPREPHGRTNGNGRDHGGDAAAAAPRAERPLPELARRHGIDPFTLFCAYYLGITADDRYEFQNIHQVAKRFGTSAGVVRQLLSDFGMDTDSIVNSSFDMAGAQVDVMHVPEGVSRTEIARTHYETFMTAPRGRRDWARELADDAAENEKTFGPSRANARRRS